MRGGSGACCVFGMQCDGCSCVHSYLPVSCVCLAVLFGCTVGSAERDMQNGITKTPLYSLAACYPACERVFAVVYKTYCGLLLRTVRAMTATASQHDS